MKLRRGTSIIEIVIATALISVSIISALSLANHSQKQNSYSITSAQASKYTSQAIDWIRTQRDTLGWSTIATKSAADSSDNQATYCLNTLPSSTTNFTDLSPGTCSVDNYISDTIFQRQMIIDTSSQASGILKISVIVTWMENIARQTRVELELTQ